MDSDYLGQLEIRLDEMQQKINALQNAVTQIPQINFQTDPSRPAGVVVDPAAIVEDPK